MDGSSKPLSRREISLADLLWRGNSFLFISFSHNKELYDGELFLV